MRKSCAEMMMDRMMCMRGMDMCMHMPEFGSPSQDPLG